MNAPLRALVWGLLGIILGMGVGYLLFTLTPQFRARLAAPTPPPQTAPSPTPAAPTTPAAGRGLIFFMGSQGKTSGIFTIRPDGTGRRLLAPAPDQLHDQQFRISRDGRRMAYLGPEYTVYVMQTDGRGKRQITSPSDTAVYDPAISPDGQVIIIPKDDSLYRVNADGSKLRRLTVAKKGYTDLAPQFSPDGRQVAFLHAPSDTDAGGDVLVVDLASRVEKVLFKGGFLGTPQWSSDGRYVANYWDEMGVDDGECTIIDTRNGNQYAIAHGIHPVFSPTENLLAFHDTRPGAPGISFIRPDGSGRRSLPGAKHADSDPVISPDGQRMLVTQWDEQGNHTIFILNIDGSGRKTLTKGYGPQWVRQ
ncbi:MAG: TolB family protein [Armatimonadota bacterium]